MGKATVLVTDELVETFRGWLEFAGPDHIPGVAHCPSWPKEFTIQELGQIQPEFGSHRLWGFEVSSPAFEKDLGYWCPIFHKHDEIGPMVYEGDGTWCAEPWRSCLPDARSGVEK